ncbi:WXG100 family type VII secretion target [Paenibacillus harenae]|uniref:WXG100 family type VII secretion target n=1 Tax=Paenibacillus harenae TaxID=306543 RepID=A0ABT9TXA3_PAEHA|nr:WXG100 family type VII secretion target [Paenibacillus harenae]MDQ0110664.1 WXG100 family type VII secretion target [Paenibacillus harenae]
MQIRITPEEMEQVARTFLSNAEQTSSIVQTLTSTMDNLAMNWEGATKNSFYGEFQTQKESMKAFVELLNKIHGDLMIISGNFRQADQQL